MSKGKTALRRQATVRPGHAGISIVCQCTRLGVSRSSLHCKPKDESATNLAPMREGDRLFLEDPFFGVRKRHDYPRGPGYMVGKG